MAGIISLLNDYFVANGGTSLGFLNPLLYGYARAGLNDITSGFNPGCGTNGFSAKEGWDPVRPFTELYFRLWLTLGSTGYWSWDARLFHTGAVALYRIHSPRQPKTRTIEYQRCHSLYSRLQGDRRFSLPFLYLSFSVGDISAWFRVPVSTERGLRGSVHSITCHAFIGEYAPYGVILHCPPLSHKCTIWYHRGFSMLSFLHLPKWTRSPDGNLFLTFRSKPPHRTLVILRLALILY